MASCLWELEYIRVFQPMKNYGSISCFFARFLIYRDTCEPQICHFLQKMWRRCHCGPIAKSQPQKQVWPKRKNIAVKHENLKWAFILICLASRNWKKILITDDLDITIVGFVSELRGEFLDALASLGSMLESQ